MDRKITIAAGVLWITGLAAAIIGLNLEGSTGTWLTVCGNIAFLLGLGLEGVLWARKRKAANPDTGTDPESEPSGQP